MGRVVVRLALFFFLLSPFGVSAMPETSSRYVLVDIVFTITGASRPGALLGVSGLEPGTIYDSPEELETALATAKQDLLNRRVFDSVDVEWNPLSETSGRENGATLPDLVPVEAVFSVDDGWTLLAVPFYRYDSNSGHNPLVAVYWDNIAGTLTDFSLTSGYYSRDWVTPFFWDINLKWEKLRLLGRTWGFSFRQDFRTLERADPLGDLELSYTRNTTKVSFQTGFRIYDRLSYSISPIAEFEYGFSEVINVNGEPIPGDSSRFGFSHSIGGGRIDWYENFRNGNSWNLSNSLAFVPSTNSFSSGIGSGIKAFSLVRIPVAGTFLEMNPGIRVQVFHDFNGDRLGLGSMLRGVADNRVYGRTGLVVQSQVGFLLFHAPRIVEVQVIPYFDTGIVRKEGSGISGDDISAGVGFELLFFPDFLRGYQGRISVGFDVRDTQSMELSIVETFAF